MFGSPEEVRIAFDAREMEEHARIKVRIEGALVQTTVGRVILSEVLPAGMPFANANKLMTKKEMTKLIDAVYRQSGHRETVTFLDKIKDIGFTYATRAGISICIDNMHIPTQEGRIASAKAQREVNEIERQYAEGLITNGERYNKVIDIWAHVTEQVANEMMKELGRRRGSEQGRILQSHLHDGRLRGARKFAADPSVGRDARIDGKAVRRNHRDSDYRQFP